MTRDVVKQVAKELFRHHTHDKTTVQDIARAMEEDRLPSLVAPRPEDRISDLFGFMFDEYRQSNRSPLTTLENDQSSLLRHPCGFFEVDPAARPCSNAW